MPPRTTKPVLDAKTRMAVIYGPEEMVKRQRVEELRAALTQAHGEVETFSFDGRTATLADVLDEVRSYSLMQTYKLVIVDEADQFVGEQTRPAMERYAAEPVDHATLVLRDRVWHKGKLDKLVEKVGAVVKCEALKPAQLRDELVRRAKAEHGRTLAPAAATLLAERLGPELMKLDTELAKLALMVDPGATIGRDLVEQTVARGSDEQAWAVQDAILEAMRTRAIGPAIAKVHDLVDLSGQADVLVNYFAADLVRKLNVALLARREGVSDFEIGKQLKLWGPRQQAFMAAVRHLDAKSVGRLFDRAVTADARSKSGLGTPVRNLECFCAALADEKQ